jgi:hypothetical protein
VGKYKIFGVDERIGFIGLEDLGQSLGVNFTKLWPKQKLREKLNIIWCVVSLLGKYHVIMTINPINAKRYVVYRLHIDQTCQTILMSTLIVKRTRIWWVQVRGDAGNT